jgi:hypothetical protein
LLQICKIDTLFLNGGRIFSVFAQADTVALPGKEILVLLLLFGQRQQ